MAKMDLRTLGLLLVILGLGLDATVALILLGIPVSIAGAYLFLRKRRR